jgi:hypothetical protein
MMNVRAIVRSGGLGTQITVDGPDREKVTRELMDRCVEHTVGFMPTILEMLRHPYPSNRTSDGIASGLVTVLLRNEDQWYLRNAVTSPEEIELAGGVLYQMMRDFRAWVHDSHSH